MWNNYGLTDFNPADDAIELTSASASGEAVTVNATGTSGNVKETIQTYSFIASLEIPRAGHYSLLLDVGQRMARKYYLTIDGKKVFDFNNLWLPPTTSAIVELSAGKHAIVVQGERNDKPVLYWRPVFRRDRIPFTGRPSTGLHGFCRKRRGGYHRLPQVDRCFSHDASMELGVHTLP